MIISAEEQFPNHVMLNSKNVGTSKALTGNVGMHFYLVNDGESFWDEKAVSKLEKAIAKAIKQFETQAAEYGTWLKLKYSTKNVSVNKRVDRSNWRSTLKTVLAEDSFKSVEAFKTYYEKKYGFNDSCIVLVFNKVFRSYASSADTVVPRHTECSVVGKTEGFFTSNFSAGVIMHEILHLFGAQDLYYPLDIRICAECYFERSLMIHSDCKVVDPLTAYLVGWKKHIDRTTREFLNATKNVTRKDVLDACEKEWKK
ncbi:MAG: hypothetical protein IKU84_03180 [Clostridia bacterium]|nr:hypothetical protein [Clostridia bacterium]